MAFLTQSGGVVAAGEMMERRYVTVDVFTDRRFGGNPLAVVLDAQGMSTSQMQAVASEFNYSETAFVLAPRDPQHTAYVRIFTTRVEVPFAGHPNVGTAFVLARERQMVGGAAVKGFVFEEAGGLVSVCLLHDAAGVVGAELTAPQSLSVGRCAPPDQVAACLGLGIADLEVSRHPPTVLSVGLPFLVVEVSSREALRRARPQLALHEVLLPPLGTDSIYCYVRTDRPADLCARMFSPIDGCVEDPATGSATAAMIAHLASLDPEPDADLSWRVEQGVDMGRPSLLLGRTSKKAGVICAVHIGGSVVEVMRGTLRV